MKLYQLEERLQKNFPAWKVKAYDVPDMWSGITINTRFSGFDVKVVENDSVLVDYGKRNLNSELNSLVEFLNTHFASVESRLI